MIRFLAFVMLVFGSGFIFALGASSAYWLLNWRRRRIAAKARRLGPPLRWVEGRWIADGLYVTGPDLSNQFPTPVSREDLGSPAFRASADNDGLEDAEGVPPGSVPA